MTHQSLTAHTRPAELFITRLRTETSPAHEALENLAISKAIVSPAVREKDYVDYLSLMANVVHDAETNIFPTVKDVIPDLDCRRKLPTILDDLAFHGAEKTAFTTVFRADENLTEAFAVGVVYVMEGSSLGGRMILKNLDKSLGLNSERGSRYFTGYGAQTGFRWKSFMEWLAGYESSHDCGHDIIRGANHAFASIHRHFAQHS